jgi:hypothetical protein
MSKKGRRMPSQLLKDMREVYKQESAAQAKTAGQRLCWGVRTKDPDKFVDRLGRLEQAHRVGQAKAQPKPAAEPEGPVERDAGASRVLELLDQGIAADEERLSEEDAEYAARPGAAALGADRQSELRAALWDERQLWKQVRALERTQEAAPRSNWMYQIERELSDSLHASLRARDVELAIHPEPGKVVGSLQRAIEGTREREEELRKKLAELER